MKKSLRYLLILLLGSVALFSITGANATLTREEVPEIQRLLPENKTINHIAGWLKYDNIQTAPKDKRDFITEAAPIINMRPDQLARAIEALDEVPIVKMHPSLPYATKHAQFPFMFCICHNLRPDLRYITILMQTNAILQKYPPQMTSVLVHTSFAEEGLLQTYCLVYTLNKLGYRAIHVNVIGCEIFKKVGSMMKDEPPYPPEQVVEGAIRGAFSSIPGVRLEMYRWTDDYIGAVKTSSTPPSMSFDMIDSSKDHIVTYYPAAVHLPELFKYSNKDEIERAITNPNDLGPLKQYKTIRIMYYAIPRPGSKCASQIIKLNEIRQELQRLAPEERMDDKKKIGIDLRILCKTLNIQKTAPHEYNLRLIMEKEVRGTPYIISEQDVPRLIEALPIITRIIEHQMNNADFEVFATLDFITKQNIETFSSLIEETSTPGQEPVAFEANNHRLFTYSKLPGQVHPAAAAAAGSGAPLLEAH